MDSHPDTQITYTGRSMARSGAAASSPAATRGEQPRRRFETARGVEASRDAEERAHKWLDGQNHDMARHLLGSIGLAHVVIFTSKFLTS
jgi:hypothetical protein